MPNYERINPGQLAAQFTQLDRQDRERALNAREAQVQGELTAMRALRTDMQDLVSILEDFSGTGNAIVSPQASSADDSIITATSDANAVSGSYAIRVEQMAQLHQVSVGLSSTTLPTDGELVIDMQGSTVAIDLATLPASASLQDLVEAINDHPSNPGIDASVINAGVTQHLVFTSRETGQASQFTLSFNQASDPAGAQFDTDLQSINVMSSGQDARVLIGQNAATAIEITSASNRLEGAIEGVELDLHATSAGEVVNITVADDTESVQESLQTFVDSYNEIVASISDEDGALYRDSTSRQIVNQMRSIMSTQYEGQSLYSIGIEFNRDGQLTIGSGRLNDALEESTANVNTILSGSNGVFQALDERITEYSNSSGLIIDRTNSLQERLDLVNSQQERFSALMDLRYERYLSEFTALQTTMAQMETSMTQFG